VGFHGHGIEKIVEERLARDSSVAGKLWRSGKKIKECGVGWSSSNESRVD
jgi:hypothetical protein